jgi:hypothetical protein
MKALVYTTFAELRYQLLDQGFSPGLPLPD